MPFITNDVKSMLIGTKEFKENAEMYSNYVIVRRLFVSSKMPLENDVSMNKVFGQQICLKIIFFFNVYLQELYDTFEKYGEIESIDEVRGYITYKTDSSACLAFRTEKEFLVKIAYSWDQPKSNESTVYAKNEESDDGKTPPFLDLCPKLLCDVFDRCDNKSLVNASETSEYFKDVLENVHTYSKIDREFSVSVDDQHSSMALIDCHKMFSLMGTYFETLKFHFYFPKKHIRFYRNMIQCFMQQAAKYCMNVQTMKLIFSAFELSLIEPLFSTVFENLLTLELSANENKPFDASLILTQCPNLRKLDIGFSNIRLSKSWPSLENVKLSDVRYEKYLSFFKQNPQLRRVKCVYDAVNFESLVKRLPNIDKLTTKFHVCESFDSLIHLRNFENMTRLTLEGVFCDNLTEIAQFISVLMKIKRLKIVFSLFKDNEADDDKIEKIVTIARKFPNLERLKLVNLKLKQEHAAHLQGSLANVNSLDLHLCSII